MHGQLQPEADGIPREGWIALGVGALLAGVVMQLPFLSFVFSYFTVLTHELGHTIFGWLYGYPSVPAFDFVYGGGITQHTERQVFIAVAVQLGLLWLVWLFWRNVVSGTLAAATALLYAITAWTSLHEAVITAMGHGFELFVAGLFLHRALSGNACHHGAERVAYGFVGSFVTFERLRFAYGIVWNPFERQVYEQAKGGGHWMDFSVLAEQHFQVPLRLVAFVFLMLCYLPPLLAWLVNQHGAATERVVTRLRALG